MIKVKFKKIAVITIVASLLNSLLVILAWSNDYSSVEKLEDSSLLLRNEHHTVLFSENLVLFQPSSGNISWQFTFQHATLKGMSDQLVRPVNENGNIVYHRGALKEAYIPLQKSIEQIYIIEEPIEENLTITGQIESDGTFEARQDHWVWNKGVESIVLNDVYAFDAEGNEVPAEMFVSADQMTIKIQKTDLIQASYPITIDPEIGSGTQTVQNEVLNNLPDAVYLPGTNEYAIIYDELNESCSTSTVIKVKKIDAISGIVTQTEQTLMEINDLCDNTYKATNPKVYFSEDNNLLMMAYLAEIGSFPSFTQQVRVNFFNSDFQLVADTLILDEIVSTRFYDLSLDFDASSNRLLVGYHQKVSDHFEFHIKSINVSSYSLHPQEIIIDKDDFPLSGNTGPRNSKLSFGAANGDAVAIFSVRYDLGAEVWGVPINGSSQTKGSAFQISPTSEVSSWYINPSVTFNVMLQDWLIAYEDMWNADTNYELSENIYATSIDSNYEVSGINHVEVSNITTGCITNCFEETKLPSVVYSPNKREYVISFYGVYTDQGIDRYDIYTQNISEAGNRVLPTSTKLESDVGPELIQNLGMKSNELAYNTTNNQFLMLWYNHVSNLAEFQISRYINNDPTSLSLSSTSAPENLSINSTICNFQTIDPDPEDIAFTYELVSGAGDDHNSYFRVNNAELKNDQLFNFEALNNLSLRVRVSDSKGGTREEVFNISITDVNELPTDLNLDNSSISENNPINFNLSVLTSNDEDQGDSHTYDLVSGSGDDDNSSFSIDGSSLIITEASNFEQKNGYKVRISTSDQGGLSFEKAVEITVVDENESPSNIALSNTVLEENNSSGFFVGKLSAEDPDAGTTLSFVVNGNVPFSVREDSLFVDSTFNFEVTSNVEIPIKVIDNGSLEHEQSITIQIRDVNDAPDTIQLSSNSINENIDSGAVVGTLTTIDEDAEQSHTYSIEANDDLYLQGNTLLTKRTFNFEANNTFNIQLTSTDDQGLDVTNDFQIEVIDVNEAPQEILLSGNQVSENMESGSVVGKLSVIDEDTGQSHLFSLNGNDDFIIEDNTLLTSRPLNFETQSSFDLSITATDNLGLDTTYQFIIQVINENDTPSDIQISNSEVIERAAKGTFIGLLSAIDEDVSDTFSFEIVDGNAFVQIREDSIFSDSTLLHHFTNEFSCRVQVTDAGGAKFQKDIFISVRNIPDFEPPIVEWTQSSTIFPLNAQQIDLGFSAHDNEGISSRTIYYLDLRSNKWLSSPLNESSNDVAISKDMLNGFGIHYFISAIDFESNVGSTDTLTLLLELDPNLPPTIANISGSGKLEDYRMIAFPYELPNKAISQLIEDDLGTAGTETWRFFHYIDGKYNEYPTQLSSVERGKGYWINSKINSAIDLNDAQHPEYQINRPFTLQLNKGWNQIGNPYPFDINWNNILASPQNKSLSSNELPLYVFTSGAFNVSNSLAAFQGAFVYAREATSLVLDYSQASSGRLDSDIMDYIDQEDEWFVNLTLRNDKAKFNAGGIGISKESTDQVDRKDWFYPPSIGDQLHYFFPHPTGKKITRDNKKSDPGLKLWKLQLNNPFSGESELRWNSILASKLPGKLVLFDPFDDVTVDMQQNEMAQVNPASSRLIILYGNEVEIEEYISNFSIEISEAYPNPTQHNVQFRITSPSQISNQLEFTLFDVQGRQVFDTESGLRSGNSEIEFRLNRQRMSPGLYFYQLKVKSDYYEKSFKGKLSIR